MNKLIILSLITISLFSCKKKSNNCELFGNKCGEVIVKENGSIGGQYYIFAKNYCTDKRVVFSVPEQQFFSLKARQGAESGSMYCNDTTSLW